jgi:alcohol dehydrogenase, propanol-preferring
VVNRSCQTCEYCKRTGAEAFCDAPTHLTTGKWGTFQEYITVSALYAHKIPDGVDLAKAAPTQCAVSRIHIMPDFSALLTQQ